MPLTARRQYDGALLYVVACLSILGDSGPVRVAANPIFPFDPVAFHGGAEIGFEVFDVDASELKSLVGSYRCFCIDETSGILWAQLKSLELCVSSHPGLAMLRGKPTLRGVLVGVEDHAIQQ